MDDVHLSPPEEGHPHQSPTPNAQSRHRASTTKRLGLAIVVAVAIVGALAVFVFRPSTGDRDAELIEEFGSAYPSTPSPTGITKTVELVAAPTTSEITNGTLTEVWAYNGTVPGPAIRAVLGETIAVNFKNDLPEASTIHWHGIRVPNDMDGVPHLNQTPVQPGDTFRYEFTPPDPGTFWYHSHTNGSEQLDRGLYGSLVVEDASAPPYSQDVVWIIDDWLFDDAGQIVEDFDDPHATQHNGRWGNVVTTNGTVSPRLDARPGERIRLRVVNASNGRPYAPTFGGLDAQLIGVDGMLVRDAKPADGFVLAPGSRMDVDLALPSTPVDVFVTEDFNGEGYTLGRIVSSGAPVLTPGFETPANPLVPEWASAVGARVDQEYVLDYVVTAGETASPDTEQELTLAGGEPVGMWTFNGRTFANQETYSVDAGAFIKIRLTNPSQAMHPIHLHGQFFKVVAIDGESVDEGHFRDTILVLSGQEIDIALIPFDIGQWALHCHIQEHATAGMTTTFDVQPVDATAP